MNEILASFLDNYEGILPSIKIELFRMNVRFSKLLNVARNYKAKELKYEIDEFNDKRYIMLEGIVPFGIKDNKRLDAIEAFKMLAEMQLAEDDYQKEVKFTGHCTYIAEKGLKGFYFRVDMPFSKQCVRVMGGMSFFIKYLHIIAEEGKDEQGTEKKNKEDGASTEGNGREDFKSKEGTERKGQENTEA